VAQDIAVRAFGRITLHAVTPETRSVMMAESSGADRSVDDALCAPSDDSPPRLQRRLVRRGLRCQSGWHGYGVVRSRLRSFLSRGNGVVGSVWWGKTKVWPHSSKSFAAANRRRVRKPRWGQKRRNEGVAQFLHSEARNEGTNLPPVLPGWSSLAWSPTPFSRHALSSAHRPLTP
jgi:hypothetical protein